MESLLGIATGPTRHRYVWVIDATGIPFILERGLCALKGRSPKHSNLTGGKPASMGGELWFRTESSLYLSGGSGRYRPREQQLAGRSNSVPRLRIRRVLAGMGRRRSEKVLAMTMDMTNRIARVFGATDGTTPEEAARRSSVKFVRGRAQLSRVSTYEGVLPGHVISAKEALDNYGFDVLEEAVECGAALLLKEPNAPGSAIRRQRQSLGLTMEEVARYTGVATHVIEHIECSSGRGSVTVQELEQVAFKLGLDEAQIAYQGLAADTAVAARLKKMKSSSDTTTLSPKSVLTFTEAASVIRAQHRLMSTLDVDSTQRAKFIPDDYYGSGENPRLESGARSL